MQVYTYARVSTDKQSNSIDFQQKTLAEFCERKGYLNPIHLADEAVSGGKELFSRPQGKELLNAKKGDVIIALRSDRMYRNFRDAVNTTLDIIDAGIKLIFLSSGEEPISMDIEKELSLYINFAIANAQRRQIGKNTFNGLMNRKLNGQTNSREKLGFTNIGKGKEGKEIRNEKEIELLRYMHELRESGLSYKVIAKRLNNEGKLTKTGKEWRHGNIPKALERAEKNGLIEKAPLI